MTKIRTVKRLILLMALLPWLASAQTPCREALMKYAERYPAAEATDLYKLVFQDLYGPGHLLTDSLTAVRYISKEVDEMAVSTCFPLYEYTLCDSNFVRVNLLLVKHGIIPLEQLVSALLRSARELPTPNPKFVMTHSDAFKVTYNPHYRIIRRDIFEREFLSLIDNYLRSHPVPCTP